MSDATSPEGAASDATPQDRPASGAGSTPTTGSGLRVALAIARAETRQDYYASVSNWRKRALLLVGGVAFLPVVGLFLLGAAVAGEGAAAGELDGLRHVARWWLPAIFGGVVLQGAFLLSSEVDSLAARELLLSTVPDRTLVLARLFALGLGIGLTVALPVAVLFAAFGYGAGSVAAAVAGAVAATLVLVAGLLCGVAVGLAGRLALYRVPLSTDARELYGTVLKVGLLVGIGAVSAVGGATLGDVEDSNLGLSLLAPAGPPPAVGHAADWLFVATPLVDGVGAAAAASGLGVVALIPLSTAAVLELAPRLWYADPAKPTDDADERGAGAPNSAATGLPSFLDGGRLPALGTTGVVVDGLVRRVARRPARLVSLAYYAFVPVVIGGSMLAVGELPATTVAGGSALIVGLWLAGGVFCLNQLGEEGTMLGQLVRSATPATTLVRARLLAGTALGAPLVLAGTGLLALDWAPPARVAVLGAYWLALVPASAGLALGLGTLLPNTETRKILDAVEVRAPETLALAAHAVLVAVLADGARRLAAASLDPAVRAGLAGALPLAAVLAGHGGYRFAVRRLADHGRPRRSDPVFAVELAAGLALTGLVLSVQAPTGVGLLVDLDGIAEYAVGAFLAPYAGWATVVAAYLGVAGTDFLDVRRPTAADLRTAAVGTVAALALWGGAVGAVELLGLPFTGHALAERATGSTAALALTLVLGLLVVAPVEELLFRNVLQKRLGEALDRPAALAVATLLFGAVHLPAYATDGLAGAALPLALVTAVGGVFALVYDRTGTVVAAALCHGAYNAVVFLVAA